MITLHKLQQVRKRKHGAKRQGVAIFLGKGGQGPASGLWSKTKEVRHEINVHRSGP